MFYIHVLYINSDRSAFLLNKNKWLYVNKHIQVVKNIPKVNSQQNNVKAQ